MKSFLIRNKREVAMFLLFAFGIFLIFFRFTSSPKVWIDEGVYTETARNFAMHGVMGLQIEPGVFYPINYLLSTGYPVIFPVSLSLKTLGIGLWQARLPMVLYMLALMFVFYAFVKRKYGFTPAVFSTLFLLSFAPFYGNGRPVQGEVPGLFFMVLGALFLLNWEASKFTNRKWAFFAGLAFGLSASTKPIFLLGLGAVVFIALIVWYKKFQQKTLLMFLLGSLVPIVIWLFVQFPDLESLKKLLPLYAHIASTQTDATLSTLETIRANLLKFFTESSPVLFMILFLTTGFSLLWKYYPIRIFKKLLNESEDKSVISISEFVLFGFIVVNWLGFLFGTGWYRYFFPANVLVYVLFPAMLIGLKDCIKSGVFKKIIYVIPIGLLLFQFTHLFFLSETAITKKITKNTDLQSIFSNIEPSKTVFFYGGVDSIIFFKGNNYSQYLLMGDFLDTANKMSIYNNKLDYIITGASPSTEFTIPCYNRKLISGYYLYEKIHECKI